MMWIGKCSASAIVLAVVSASSLTIARADLVYDDESVAVSAESQAEDRDQLRKVYKTTQQVETSNEISVSTEPVVAEVEDAPAMTRSELLRRKRIREEMKNEDLLTQRLEELRLREETKRTKKLLKTSGLEDDQDESRVETESHVRTMSPAPVIQETTVVTPITEKPGSEPNSMQMTPAPQVPQVAYVQPQMAQSTDTFASMQSGAKMSSQLETGRNSGEGRISIAPRIGFTTISNDYYDFSSKYAAGLGVGFGVSDHLSVELGYTYSQNSIRMPNYGNPFQEVNFNQNLFDLGLKLAFVGPDAKVRPYVSGGGGYSMGYINYDQRTQDQIRRYNPYMDVQDYELNQIVGTLGAGLDFQVGKNASIGVGYKLIAPLASNEDNQIWNYAFGVDPVKDQVRGSLRDSSTHMFLVSGGFSF